MTGDDSTQTTTENLRWTSGSCIRYNVIDTWCKLVTVLWLYEHKGQRLSGRQLSERLYQADEGMMRSILVDLCEAGLLVEVDQQYELSSAPEVTACLNYLKQDFADPRTRQCLIERIREAGPGVQERGHDL